MEYTSPSDLKTILHSKRANIYYLEHCRVLVNGGRVEYVTEESNRSLYWNIPIANTTSILLGTGTSVTQSAMREFAKAGVMVGFCGGAGIPLFSGTEREFDVAWITPQSEYRPTEYLQAWSHIFFEEERRLAAAKVFQTVRLKQVQKHWLSQSIKRQSELSLNDQEILDAITKAEHGFNAATSQTEILTKEAAFAKTLYKIMANAVSYGQFVRAPKGSGTDPANRFLDQGNYLAYGLAATAAWVLGLPHGFAVLHGKTRRGGLVFYIADLIKDALVLPTAFISAMHGESTTEFRQHCVDAFQRAEALDVMIDTIKDIAKHPK
jgi:CRISP-associated protein Cas1